MRRALPAIGIAALLVLLSQGIHGALFGGAVAGREIQRAPAVVVAISLVVLLRGPAALPAAAGWALLGAAVAVAWRMTFGTPGEDGWLPSEDVSWPSILAEAGWLSAIAVMAWRGLPPAWAGPLVAGVVATTRIGAYGLALAPLVFEDTLRDALLVGINILAGFAAGLVLLLLAGWALAILSRFPATRIAPGRVLAALAATAAIGHMLRL